MNAIDADPDSLLIARLAALLSPIIDGPTAAAVRAELDRLADTPPLTLQARQGHADHQAPPSVPLT